MSQMSLIFCNDYMLSHFQRNGITKGLSSSRCQSTPGTPDWTVPRRVLGCNWDPTPLSLSSSGWHQLEPINTKEDRDLHQLVWIDTKPHPLFINFPDTSN